MPCEGLIRDEPPAVWSHWWHSERWAQFAGRAPDDLTAEEIAHLVQLWTGISLDPPLARAHIHKRSAAGFVYLAHYPARGRTKVGMSAHPASRAAQINADHYCHWFVGTAAVPLEQTILALLAPWQDGTWSETALVEPEPVARLVAAILHPLPWWRDEPEGYDEWSFRRRMQWSFPFWEHLLGLGMPGSFALGLDHHWLPAPEPAP